MNKLALFGGEPKRRTPFQSGVMIDQDERNMIQKVLESRAFSRFMGSPTADIDKQLEMPSIEALNYSTQHFTFLGGSMIRQFEADFAAKFGVSYAITVNSATSGLSAALGACDINPGDEVITTCLSFNATAVSLLAFNAVPIFVDVDPDNFCLDPKEIEKKITDKTKVIVVVHLLGNCADMDSIMALAKKYNLKVIEDCAQAPGVQYQGKPVGTIGDLGVFSFQETKNISTGEGGMIVTSNSYLAKKCRLIRNHGESVPHNNASLKELINIVGFNFRMTELTAAMGVAQLKKLDENNLKRQENAVYLAEKLRDLKGITIPDVITRKGHICHVFPIIYDESVTGVKRKSVIDAIRAEGIVVGTGYLKLIPENPIFSRRIAFGNDGWPFKNINEEYSVNYQNECFPVAKELISKKYIWFYHVNRPNTLKDMQDVVDVFKKVFSNMEELRTYQSDEKELVYKW